MKILKVYTDGSYKPSLKRGVISFIVLKDNKIVTEVSKLMLGPSTNNQMELQAVIAALDWLRSNGHSPKKHRVYIYTDSQYVQLGLDKWAVNWRKNGWRNSRGIQIHNYSYWKYLLDLIDNEFSSVYCHWVEGHNGDPWNLAVDKLCKTTLKKGKGKNIDVQQDE